MLASLQQNPVCGQCEWGAEADGVAWGGVGDTREGRSRGQSGPQKLQLYFPKLTLHIARIPCRSQCLCCKMKTGMTSLFSQVPEPWPS